MKISRIGSSALQKCKVLRHMAVVYVQRVDMCDISFCGICAMDFEVGGEK